MPAACSEVVIPAGLVATELELQRRAAKAAALGTHQGIGLVKAAPGAQHHRAAQGVEAVERVGAGQHGDFGQGQVRDQIPVDGIAKAFIHAHAVQKHRQALRRAERRRRGEAAKLQIKLERVTCGVVDVGAADLLSQQGGQVAGTPAVQVVALQALGRQGQFAQRNAQTGKQGHAHHLHAVGQGRHRQRGPLGR
jgi:hypothetical protein